MKNSYVTRHYEVAEADLIVTDQKYKSVDVLILLEFYRSFYLFIYFTSNLIFFTMDCDKREIYCNVQHIL